MTTQMTDRTEAEQAEREQIAALGLGEGNEDLGQFQCDDCAGCARREVCFE